LPQDTGPDRATCPAPSMELMKHTRILLIDNDPVTIDLLGDNFKKEGFSIEAVSNGEAALAQFSPNSYDLIILELALPDIQGLDVCRHIRRKSDIPLIILSARNEEIDKILGLEMGADDYITKPFSIKELVARIKAILRRGRKGMGHIKTEKAESDVLALGGLVIDRERYTVTIGNRLVPLSATEFKLLVHLMKRPNRIVHRDHLLSAVWGDVDIDSRTVDVHIRRLRMKLESDPDNPQYIKTMRGAGYFFEAKES